MARVLYMIAFSLFVLSCLCNAAKKEENWMGSVVNRSKTLLSSISIPGTHESGAFGFTGLFKRWYNCQDKTVAQQLKSGIRAFDIRVRKSREPPFCGVDEPLRICHGAGLFACKKGNWKKTLKQISKFLDSHPTESVILKIKHEKGDWLAKHFKRDLYADLKTKKKYFYTAKKMPTLTTAAGKIVFLSDFGSSKMKNYPFTSYQKTNDSKFWSQKFDKPGKNKRVGDIKYAIDVMCEKGGSATTFQLTQCNASTAKKHGFLVVFVRSGTPRKWAKYINKRVLAYLKEKNSSECHFAGIVSTDYPTKALIDGIIEMNVLDRKKYVDSDVDAPMDDRLRDRGYNHAYYGCLFILEIAVLFAVIPV